MNYGVLKTSANTGNDSDLAMIFVAPLSITSHSPSMNSTTLSLKSIRSRNPSQRWEISANVFPGFDATGYFMKTIQAGDSDSIHVRMPPVLGTVAMPTATVFTVQSTAAVDSSVLSVTSSGVQLSEAAFITFPGDPKVYSVVSHVGAALTIFPKLRKAVAAASVISHSATVVMKAILSTDTLKGITFVDGVLSNPGVVKVVEDI